MTPALRPPVRWQDAFCRSDWDQRRAVPLLTSIGPLLPDIRAASGIFALLFMFFSFFSLPVIAMGVWRWPLAGSIDISVKSAVLR